MNISTSALVILATVLTVIFLLQGKYKLDIPKSFGISLFLVLAAVLWLCTKYEAIKSYSYTQGTIVQRYTGSTFEGVTYCFKATFIDNLGKAHTISTHICSSKPRYTIGDVVSIAYPEAMPEKAVISDPLEVYILPVLLGVLGLMLLSIDTYKIFVNQKREAA